jgi:hypothetical protein
MRFFLVGEILRSSHRGSTSPTPLPLPAPGSRRHHGSQPSRGLLPLAQGKASRPTLRLDPATATRSLLGPVQKALRSRSGRRAEPDAPDAASAAHAPAPAPAPRRARKRHDKPEAWVEAETIGRPLRRSATAAVRAASSSSAPLLDTRRCELPRHSENSLYRDSRRDRQFLSSSCDALLE